VSILHPIISVTGSSGAGTTSVRRTFEHIFRREKITAAFIEGDAFHRYDRESMKRVMADEATQGNRHFSHFGPQANLLAELQETFSEYCRTGSCRTRHYIHDAHESRQYDALPGTFTDWETIGEGADLLFYEGLHGCSVTPEVNLAKLADLRLGVVPVVNLEWIQKIHRDHDMRGYSTEAVVETILRRMPDYANYICPQFSRTQINFQRVPTVDTSNPFIAQWIPTPEESMVVVRFADPRGIDFPYLLSMICGSQMSRANSLVVPGGKLDLAMQLILTPLILQLLEKKRRAA
jgi:phosphoribulokinase